ncbi:hypothetical protein ACJX0J_018355, partial [Zea mays]
EAKCIIVALLENSRNYKFTSSDHGELEANEQEQFEEIGDIALFVKRYHEGLIKRNTIEHTIILTLDINGILQMNAQMKRMKRLHQFVKDELDVIDETSIKQDLYIASKKALLSTSPLTYKTRYSNFQIIENHLNNLLR